MTKVPRYDCEKREIKKLGDVIYGRPPRVVSVNFIFNLRSLTFIDLIFLNFVLEWYYLYAKNVPKF